MIIGVSGLLEDDFGNKMSAGSGKDTVSDMFSEFGFIKIALADPIKRFCGEIFNFSDDQLFGPSESRSKGSDNMKTINGEILTPRLALQLCGTQFGRYCYPDVWVNYCINISNTLMQDDNLAYHPNMGLVEKWDYNPTGRSLKIKDFPERNNGIIISDCRFLNEISRIGSVGKTIRVKRKCEKIENISTHESEQEIINIPDQMFDFIIDNNGSLDDLREKVRQVYLAII